MRPSKGEMLRRIESLERAQEWASERRCAMRVDLNQLTNITEQLAEQLGYTVKYKEGYYLEPIKEEPYGN